VKELQILLFLLVLDKLSVSSFSKLFELYKVGIQSCCYTQTFLYFKLNSLFK